MNRDLVRPSLATCGGIPLRQQAAHAREQCTRRTSATRPAAPLELPGKRGSYFCAAFVHTKWVLLFLFFFESPIYFFSMLVFALMRLWFFEMRRGGSAPKTLGWRSVRREVRRRGGAQHGLRRGCEGAAQGLRALGEGGGAERDFFLVSWHFLLGWKIVFF